MSNQGEQQENLSEKKPQRQNESVQENLKVGLLRKKPQRDRKKTLWQSGRQFLILLGGLVILGVVLLAVWQMHTTNASPGTGGPSSTAGASTQTAKGGGQSSNGSGSPWDSYPAVYWQTLRTQFAQGMHMTEQQVKNNLQSTYLATQSATAGGRVEVNDTAATQWLNNLAQEQGISQTQLHTIELTAVKQAHAVLVQQNVLTQQQADQTINGMSQNDLNAHMFDAFLMCTGGKRSC
jgi:hypothetical protein